MCSIDGNHTLKPASLLEFNDISNEQFKIKSNDTKPFSNQINLPNLFNNNELYSKCTDKISLV